MKKYDYILIGNSTASVAAIEGIRSADPRGSILVVGDEERFVYGRPLISYYLLGATDERRMDYRPRSFYEDNGAELRLGVRAERIDPAAKTVTFADGSAAKYGRLLVATGSRPFDPPMEGIESVPHRFHFMKMADALALEKYLSPAARVLIVGAGLIGLKCYEGIAERAGSVVIVDMADRVLSSVLDAEGATIVQRRLESKGARFYLSDCVEKYEDGVARLRGGGEIGFDILVLAVGVRPNVELVKPEKVINKSTITNMQSGIVYGYVGLVEYLVRAIKREIEEPGVKVVATGGLSEIVSAESDVFDYVDRTLTLRGLNILYNLNAR